ncbi:MAG TPA: NUDIX hydrolase [Streptosporangiaceae bacterium]|nr:NUDIX hydrolase [Streptosporangiaceae bacterium]
MAGTGFVDAETWYASLPGVVAAAGALITDPAGRVLLVKPNYRDLWSLPGGICEFGEQPQDGCRREVEEELGLGIPPGRCLVVDWTQPHGTDVRPVMHFIFDGGSLSDGGDIVLQAEELDAFRFTAPHELETHLPSSGLRRVTGALRALSSGMTIFLPHEVSASRASRVSTSSGQ